MDIYNKREGVCHHFTKLANTLLYSIGYKVIYTSGYACKNYSEFDKSTGHAWSLILIKDKWYPFDSTWGIFSGKLSVCHVFREFFEKGRRIKGLDKVDFGKNIVKLKYLG